LACRSSRYWSAREDSDRDIRAKLRRSLRVSSAQPAYHRETPRPLSGEGCEPNRVAVHRRVVEGRQIHRRADASGEHTSGCVQQGEAFSFPDGLGARDCLGSCDVDGNDVPVDTRAACVLKRNCRSSHEKPPFSAAAALRLRRLRCAGRSAGAVLLRLERQVAHPLGCVRDLADIAPGLLVVRDHQLVRPCIDDVALHAGGIGE
jgi:hypothetical protein